MQGSHPCLSHQGEAGLSIGNYRIDISDRKSKNAEQRTNINRVL